MSKHEVMKWLGTTEPWLELDVVMKVVEAWFLFAVAARMGQGPSRDDINEMWDSMRV
ncbi:hypothetical protein [Paraburkholderia unamae]|uniref:Uncharacterized protein n=1 Tax=Paraburkholderia unamae TaxID=219649 RepID=A0ACC6RH33_9BURK